MSLKKHIKKLTLIQLPAELQAHLYRWEREGGFVASSYGRISLAWLTPILGQSCHVFSSCVMDCRCLYILGCLLMQYFGIVGLEKKQCSASLNLEEQHSFSFEYFSQLKCSLETPERQLLIASLHCFFSRFLFVHRLFSVGITKFLGFLLYFFKNKTKPK